MPVELLYARNGTWVEFEFAPERPIVPPPVLPMAIGAANTPPIGQTYQQSWADLETAVGPLAVRRSYDTELPADFNSSAAAWDYGHRTSVYSAHPADMAGLAAGSMDTAILSFVYSVPLDHTMYITLYHEPDSKIRQGLYTLSDWKAAFTRFCQVVKSAKRPNVRTYLCLVDYIFNPQAIATYGFTANDMWPVGNVVDVFAPDTYNFWSPTNGKPWTEFPVLAAPLLAFAQAKNVQWAIAEYGCHEDPTQPLRRANWLQAAADYGNTNHAVFQAYFDSDVGDPDGGWWLRPYANTVAKFAALAALYQG
jgi:hypothetical protein